LTGSNAGATRLRAGLSGAARRVHRHRQRTGAATRHRRAAGPAPRVVIDGYTLANLVVSATLNATQIPLLPKAIHAIATGNPVPATQIYLTALAPQGFIGCGPFPIRAAAN
jgi:hypothetical protein